VASVLRNTDDRSYQANQYKAEGFTDAVRDVAALIGATIENFQAQSGMQVMKIALPIVQTMLLFGMVVALPLYMIFSKLSLESLARPIA
jgi:hypothetical protein